MQCHASKRRDHDADSELRRYHPVCRVECFERFQRDALTPTVTPTPTPVQVTPTPTPTATPTPIGKVGPISPHPSRARLRQLRNWAARANPRGVPINPWWNNGAARISSISIQGSGDFSIDSRDTTCGSTLAVGRLCAIAIQFTPSAGGPRQGKLVVQDNASNSPKRLSSTGRETMIRRAAVEFLRAATLARPSRLAISRRTSGINSRP